MRLVLQALQHQEVYKKGTRHSFYFWLTGKQTVNQSKSIKYTNCRAWLIALSSFPTLNDRFSVQILTSDFQDIEIVHKMKHNIIVLKSKAKKNWIGLIFEF